MAAAFNELLPFKVRSDLCSLANHVRIDELSLLGLTRDILVKSHHGLLHNLNDVSFELDKVLLYGNEIILVIVFLEDLFVEAVENAPVNNIWIIQRVCPSPSRIVTCGLLSEQLNVFLGCVSSFLNLLCAFNSPGCQLFRLTLDFLVQAVEDRENGTLEVSFGFEVRVDQTLFKISPSFQSSGTIYLCICSQVLKQPSYTSQALIEVVAFPQGVLDGLLRLENASTRPKHVC